VVRIAAREGVRRAVSFTVTIAGLEHIELGDLAQVRHGSASRGIMYVRRKSAIENESDQGEITVLLQRWKEGDPNAIESLLPHVYPHLHNVAAAYLRRESDDHTLQPTALVNELYLRLVQQRKANWNDRAHFYTFAAKLMRRILADHARATNAGKRGGELPHVPLNDEIPWVNLNSVDIIDVHRALDELEKIDSRKVRLLELRYFLGCTVEEAAELVGVSDATAERDLRLVRAWLYSTLAARQEGPHSAE